ncbi:MAG TPA: NAD-dependent epimerase/dehydratase family protein [Vicinamibacterales bacterium]|nr:NAD-dependent epimerase/dehydratase family protein [Vicinamibacterales bacterium]
MRIFLTGGTGYIGAAALEALVRGGHQVETLVRNREKAAQVLARGARPVIGDLSQPASYLPAAGAAEGIVHAGFEYSARGRDIDALAITSLLQAGAGRGRLLIYTSGVWVLGNTTVPADESAPLSPADHVAWRPSHEQLVLGAAAAGFRTVVVRPGIVYGGARGIVGELFKDAANGLVRVIGSGENHWPLVHERDLGELYARLVAHPEAAGVFHANDEADERVNELVAAIASHVPIRPSVRHVPIAEARQKLGPYADALALDQIVRSPRARAIGWHPSLHAVSRNAARLFEEWRTGREAA